MPVKYRFRRIWNDIMGTFQWRGKSGDSWRFWSFQRFPKKHLYLSHPIVLEDLDCQNKSGKCKDILQMYNLLFRCKRWVRNYNFFLFFCQHRKSIFQHRKSCLTFCHIHYLHCISLCILIQSCDTAIFIWKFKSLSFYNWQLATQILRATSSLALMAGY